MSRLITFFLLCCVLLSPLNAAINKQVFISFSMPEMLVSQVLKSAERHQVTVVLNGLIKDDMRETFKMIFKLAQKYPAVSVQIDPLAFEKYHIDAVPALVVDNGKVFDVVYGNLAIADGLSLIKRRGDLQGEAV